MATARGERLTVEDMEEVLSGRQGGLEQTPEIPEAFRMEESFSLALGHGAVRAGADPPGHAAGGLHLPGIRLLGLSRQNLKYKLKKYDL